MIPLPPGVTINHESRIVISGITTEIAEWYRDLGANVYEEAWWNGKGQQQTQTILQLPNGRCSYKMQSGDGRVILNFPEEYAGTALAFLLKFSEVVLSHNMKEVGNYVY